MSPRIRPAVADDMRFVLSTWKRSWRECPWAGTIRNDEFYAVIASTIEGLVLRGAEFLVVADPKTDRIMGWVCAETLPDGLACVHYLYVKDPFIPLGIGAQLVEAVAGTKPGLYTHRYRQVVEACRGWRHAPEVARRK